MSRLRTVVLGVLAVLAVSLLFAVQAEAHVTVDAPGAVRGGSDQQITFRVPVEEQKATVGLTVQLPTATPIASVDVLPMTGWTHTQVTSKLATPDQDRRRRHHLRRHADHLEGHGRRAQAGGVRRVHHHRRHAARRPPA